MFYCTHARTVQIKIGLPGSFEGNDLKDTYRKHLGNGLDRAGSHDL